MSDAAADTDWTELKTLLRWAAEIFGEPAALLEQCVLPSREHRLLRAWLAALEAIARALLVLMAAGLPAPRASRAARKPAAAPRAAASPPDEDEQVAAGEPIDSARWAGVVFHMLPPDPAARPTPHRSARAEPRRFLFARRLAYRLEALIRVAEAPEPFAARLARKLHAAPERASRLLGALRADARLPYFNDIFADVAPGARAALAPFLGAAPSADTG